jgi:hypothetical protein
MNKLQTIRDSAVPPPVGGGEGGIEVLVFKTSLSDVKRISDVESSLDIHPGIYKWNVDLNDCDNILRIVSRNIAAAEVENMILGAGYYCDK